MYCEGPQSKEAQERYAKINEALKSGYLKNRMADLPNADLSGLREKHRKLLCSMVDGITSEVGRALVGLTFLQLTIKSIAPAQCIRLHKGGTRRGSFSWVDGISMRSIDSAYNTPFLREYGLLNINKYGIMMTRSLAENYPYSKLYKAEMKGPFDNWIAIVDALEGGTMPPEPGLCYLMALLKNRSDNFRKIADRACKLVDDYLEIKLADVQIMLERFFNTTEYSARAFEIVLHGLLQALQECHALGEADLVPLSQMRSANKKHGNIGDVELRDGSVIIEAWDAKYGKPYLRDELEELRDKLLVHPGVKVAGFVVDSDVDLRKDIVSRAAEISLETGTQIRLFSFAQWVGYQLDSLTGAAMETIGYKWLRAVVESFAQKRSSLAPIDEPCEIWLEDLVRLLSRA